MSLFPSTEKKPFCRTYAKEKRCNLKKDYNASENPYSILPDVSICPLFRLLKFPLRLLLQSVCLYRSYRQEARQAAAAACSSPAAFLKGIGLRIYGNAVSAQRISVNLGAAPCSQCSQGSAAR